jgi:hypothetical protein
VNENHDWTISQLAAFVDAEMASMRPVVGEDATLVAVLARSEDGERTLGAMAVDLDTIGRFVQTHMSKQRLQAPIVALGGRGPDQDGSIVHTRWIIDCCNWQVLVAVGSSEPVADASDCVIYAQDAAAFFEDMSEMADGDEIVPDADEKFATLQRWFEIAADLRAAAMS